MTKKLRSTTILGIIHKGECALGGDGQVSLGNTVMKHNAMKIQKNFQWKSSLRICRRFGRCFYSCWKDLKTSLEQYHGNVHRSAVELAKDWRTDKYLRRLEAMLAVISEDKTLVISGTGDVIEPDDNIVAIGSGGMYALAAARMLKKYSNLSAKEIVNEALKTASDICIYTNNNINVEEITKKDKR